MRAEWAFPLRWQLSLVHGFGRLLALQAGSWWWRGLIQLSKVTGGTFQLMPWHCQIFYYLRNLVLEIFSSHFIHYFWQYFCFYNVCCSYIFKALMAIITFLMRVEFIIWFAFDMILSQANSVHKFLDEVGDNWEVCPCPLLIIWSLQGWNLVLENLQFFVNPLWLPFFSSLLKIVHGTGG